MTEAPQKKPYDDLKERAQDAASDIAAAADYLKTALDAGQPVDESRWLDGLMGAHGVLCEIGEDEEPRQPGKGDSEP